MGLRSVLAQPGSTVDCAGALKSITTKSCSSCFPFVPIVYALRSHFRQDGQDGQDARVYGFTFSGASPSPIQNRIQTHPVHPVHLVFSLSQSWRRPLPPIANVLVVTHSDTRGGNAETGDIQWDFRAVDNRCGGKCFLVAFGSATLSKPVTGIRGTSPAFVQRAAGT